MNGQTFSLPVYDIQGTSNIVDASAPPQIAAGPQGGQGGANNNQYPQSIPLNEPIQTQAIENNPLTIWKYNSLPLLISLETKDQDQIAALATANNARIQVPILRCLDASCSLTLKAAVGTTAAPYPIYSISGNHTWYSKSIPFGNGGIPLDKTKVSNNRFTVRHPAGFDVLIELEAAPYNSAMGKNKPTLKCGANQTCALGYSGLVDGKPVYKIASGSFDIIEDQPQNQGQNQGQNPGAPQYAQTLNFNKGDTISGAKEGTNGLATTYSTGHYDMLINFDPNQNILNNLPDNSAIPIRCAAQSCTLTYTGLMTANAPQKPVYQITSGNFIRPALPTDTPVSFGDTPGIPLLPRNSTSVMTGILNGVEYVIALEKAGVTQANSVTNPTLRCQSGQTCKLTYDNGTWGISGPALINDTVLSTLGAPQTLSFTNTDLQAIAHTQDNARLFVLHTIDKVGASIGLQLKSTEQNLINTATTFRCTQCNLRLIDGTTAHHTPVYALDYSSIYTIVQKSETPPLPAPLPMAQSQTPRTIISGVSGANFLVQYSSDNTDGIMSTIVSMPNNISLNGKLLRFDKSLSNVQNRVLTAPVNDLTNYPKDKFFLQTTGTWSIKCNNPDNNVCGTSVDPYYFVGTQFTLIKALPSNVADPYVEDKIDFPSDGIPVTRTNDDTRVNAIYNGKQIEIVLWSSDAAVIGQLSRPGSETKKPFLKCNGSNCSLTQVNGENFYTISGDHFIDIQDSPVKSPSGVTLQIPLPAGGIEFVRPQGADSVTTKVNNREITYQISDFDKSEITKLVGQNNYEEYLITLKCAPGNACTLKKNPSDQFYTLQDMHILSTGPRSFLVESPTYYTLPQDKTFQLVATRTYWVVYNQFLLAHYKDYKYEMNVSIPVTGIHAAGSCYYKRTYTPDAPAPCTTGDVVFIQQAPKTFKLTCHDQTCKIQKNLDTQQNAHPFTGKFTISYP